MLPAGYVYKKIHTKPDWLKNNQIKEICSVSSCESPWHESLHPSWYLFNPMWMADSPEEMFKGAEINDEADSFEEYTLFYYEMYEKEFHEETHAWQEIDPETIPDNVTIPESRTLLGYDAAVFQKNVYPVGCSPLSCNLIAEETSVNEYCLFSSLEEAVSRLDEGLFDRAEPGPYRIFAVYRTNGQHEN